MSLQTRVQNLIAYESATPQRTLAKTSSVPTLLQNLTMAVPNSMAALTPQISPLLATGSDREAVMAADLLQMQLSSESIPVGMRMAILDRLLDAAASGNEPVRLRIVAALPDIAAAAEQLPASASGPSSVAQALLQRLLDPAAGVRVAAVRGLGELCSKAGGELSLGANDVIESGIRIKMLQGLLGRLRDCALDVREAVRSIAQACEDICMRHSRGAATLSHCMPRAGPCCAVSAQAQTIEPSASVCDTSCCADAETGGVCRL